MDSIIKSLVNLVVNGGVTAIIALLMLCIGYLVWDRRQLTKQLAESIQQTLAAKEAEKQVILEIVEKYHQGNLTMVQAINEIRVVLAAIQGRLL